MSKLTIEIEADVAVDGTPHAPNITLTYNGKKLTLLQLVEFRATTGDLIPVLRLLGTDRAGHVLKEHQLEELKKDWPWAEVALQDWFSCEVRALP
jgi:hypothetical protein